ncbi:MAG: restriction endonuclease [Micromonosporaceae bacterium]
MSVPKFDEFMLPILRHLSDSKPRHWRELRDACVREFAISDEDQAERIGSGEPRVDNRVQWATAYLFQAGLVDRPRRGTMQITDRGRQVLADPPGAINSDYLRRYPEFRDFLARDRKGGRQPVSKATTGGPMPEASSETTPQESIEDAVLTATAALQKELLRRVVAQPPVFLELLVLRLLRAMGYGAERGDIEHRGGPADGGIDGVIRQDPLGLDRVYVQAKRYADQAVGSQEIQAFVGALHGVQADRGVFITTSRFTPNALDYVKRIPNRIVLIDGLRLAALRSNMT